MLKEINMDAKQILDNFIKKAKASKKAPKMKSNEEFKNKLQQFIDKLKAAAEAKKSESVK